MGSIFKLISVLSVSLAFCAHPTLATANSESTLLVTLLRDTGIRYVSAFEVNIYSNGTVRYYGSGASKVQGSRVFNIEKKLLDEILLEFEKAKFSELQNVDHSKIGNKPGISLTLHSINKKISIGLLGPEEAMPVVYKIISAVNLKSLVCPLNRLSEGRECDLD